MLKKLFAAGAALIFMASADAAEFGNTPIGSNTKTAAPTDPLSAVVQLVASDGDTVGFCTAFYIGNNRFVTAGHCALEGNTPFHILFQDGTFKRVDAELIAISSVNQKMADFAVLEVDGNFQVLALKGRKPLDLDCSYKAKIGDEIRVEGFPADFGFEVVWGKVSGATEKWALWAKPVIRTNIAVTQGNSGAPVFNERTGKAVGILVGGLPKNQSLSVVQPMAPVCHLLGLK